MTSTALERIQPGVLPTRIDEETLWARSERLAKTKLVPVAAGDEAYRFFLYAQQVRLFCEEVGKTVIGQPLPSRSDRANVARPAAPANVSALVD